MKRFGLCILVVLTWHPADVPAAERVPWTTSRLAGTPDPPLPFATERVFSSLKFTQPVDVAYLPGTDWMYVMEVPGKVFAVDTSLEDPQPHLVFDARALFEQHDFSYGIAFHPQVAENRYVFISWTVPGQLVEDGSTVSRFELSADDPPRIQPETRADVIQWASGGHNGACIKFGPDGYLYVSTGDGVGPFPPDAKDMGQDLSDLRSTIIRIDVDRPDGDSLYSIPPDNPFLDLDGARPEIWSYGFRNPWKMCFNPDNGDLLVGDVGWELWEMIYRVERAGNYGWSIMEGRQPVRSDIEPGPTPIILPLVDHSHVEARSITGGYVYRGERLPDLQGAYIYADFVTGKIWGLRNDTNKVTWHEELVDTPLEIVTFGENRQGELFLLDYGGGGVYRLKPNPQFGRTSDFPRRLSETGLFSDVAEQVPAAGVVPYSLIAEPWMEGATAHRFVALPERTSITTVPNRTNWKYPEGSVFVKTISLDEQPGSVGTSPRKLETQVLHFEGAEWRPYTYAWNESQTDADLVDAAGSETTVSLGGENWTWRLHGRAECSTCHTWTGGFVLGFFPQNLMTPADSSSDQLAALTEAAIFETAFPEEQLSPAIVDPRDESAELEARARAWLMMNCAHCHRREGGGTSPIELPIEIPLEQTHTIDTAATQGTFEIPHARIIAPGDPFRSVLFYRLATVGRGHMPHLGAHRVDEAGLSLIHDWIAGLSDSLSSEPVPESVATQRQTETAAVERLQNRSEGSVPPATDVVSALLESTTGSLQLAWSLDHGAFDEQQKQRLIASGAKSDNQIVRGLFERLLPEDARTKRLGTVVDPQEVLKLPGDADRGRDLFTTAVGVQCRTCHQVGNVGKSVGPKLDDVGKRLTREKILEGILDPSRTIEAKWIAQTILTRDGRVLVGLIQDRTANHTVLRDNQGNDHDVATKDIQDFIPQQKSLMPEMLVQDLTAQQLADLLEYLSSLR